MSVKVLFMKEWKSAIRSSLMWRFALMCSVMLVITAFIASSSGLDPESFFIIGVSMFAILLPVMLSSDVFVNEKRNRTILTLLTSPLSPLKIWASKALFLTSLSFIFTTGMFLIIFAIAKKVPGLQSLFLAFLVLPLLEFSVSGFMGYFFLGKLRPSAATSIGALLMMAIIFSSVYIPRFFPSFNPLSVYPAFYVLLSLILLPLSAFLVKKLDRESITAVV